MLPVFLINYKWEMLLNDGGHYFILWFWVAGKTSWWWRTSLTLYRSNIKHVLSFGRSVRRSFICTMKQQHLYKLQMLLTLITLAIFKLTPATVKQQRTGFYSYVAKTQLSQKTSSFLSFLFANIKLKCVLHPSQAPFQIPTSPKAIYLRETLMVVCITSLQTCVFMFN